MSRHNQLVNQSMAKLMKQDSNLTVDQARALIQEAIDRTTDQEDVAQDRAKMGKGGKAVGRVPGHMGKNKDMVVMFHEACNSLRNLRCNPKTPYRTIDGTCNNLGHGIKKLWGSTGAELVRLLPQHYRAPFNPDGSKQEHPDTNDLRPNPRLISSNFHPDRDHPSRDVTTMVPQFGQFLDHDLSISPEEEHEECCKEPELAQCIPINVFRNDSFFAPRRQTCLELTRSVPFCEGRTHPRNQFNAITGFIDASNVYGSDNARARLLRTFKDGKLKVSMVGEFEHLPKINGQFLAGDNRAEEMPGLATMHTLFVREHNRIANFFKGQGSDEAIYQKARRILIAEMQNVIYSEYLPALLGPSNIRDFKLMGSSFSFYDEYVNPGINAAFSTAAYRFGHSMLQGIINVVSEVTRQTSNTYRLRDNFFNLTQVFADNGRGMQRILYGLITQKAQVHDRFVTSDVTNFLFRERQNDFGSDLVARNIARGRDHGMPGYNAFREFCGLSSSCEWSDRPREISPKNWNILRSIYSNPNDIDLFVGGLAEIPQGQALTGPVFNCIKVKQFQALKDGDRFFFTHGDQAGSFSRRQIDAIRRRRLADIICDNTEIPETRINVFLLKSKMRPCSKRTALELCKF